MGTKIMANGWYVTVQHGMRGYFACMMCTDEDGFSEPWQSGIFSRDTRAKAEQDAKDWAFAEEVPFKK